MWLLAKTSEHFPKFFFIAVDRELLFFFLKAHSFGKLTLKSAFTFYDIVRSHHHVNSTCKVGRNLHFLNCHSLVAESPHNYVSNKGLEVMQDSNHKIIIPPIYAELYLQNIFMHIVSSGTQVHLVRWLPLSPQENWGSERWRPRELPQSLRQSWDSMPEFFALTPFFSPTA